MTTTEVGYVQLRRGTTEQWASPVNGVPQDGELIKNTTTGALKLGDGITPEASLPAIGSGGGGGGFAYDTDGVPYLTS